jgi:C-terminal processing protease CtpA/Prc
MADIQCDYVEKIITGSTQMSFIDKLWGFEVTGGADQGQRLTISAIKRDGLAQRAGMRVADQILRINEIDATSMSLQEAQLLISQSGRYVRIAVFG